MYISLTEYSYFKLMECENKTRVETHISTKGMFCFHFLICSVFRFRRCNKLMTCMQFCLSSYHWSMCNFAIGKIQLIHRYEFSVRLLNHNVFKNWKMTAKRPNMSYIAVISPDNFQRNIISVVEITLRKRHKQMCSLLHRHAALLLLQYI